MLLCLWGCTDIKHTSQAGMLAHYNVGHLYTSPGCLQMFGIDQQLLLMYVVKSPMRIAEFDHMRALERNAMKRRGYPHMGKGFCPEETRATL